MLLQLTEVLFSSAFSRAKVAWTQEEAKKQPGGYSWVFVCANVGDCKAFLYSPSTKQVTDITRYYWHTKKHLEYPNRFNKGEPAPQ